jgi:SAM-dependent methyltransferase
MWLKELAKRKLSQLGIFDYCIFLWEDQIKRFNHKRLANNLWYRINGAPDNLPIPSPYLIWLVVGSSDVQAFLESGSIHAFDLIQHTLEKNGITMNHFEAILDFGCGCGRIMRYWKNLKYVQLYGSDYNPILIRWCRHHLPFAQFEVNDLPPPLSFSDKQFDFVYARSIFTHLSQNLQFAWLDELWRVLKPGGYLLITVSGDQFLDRLTPPETEEYQAGNLVVRANELAGKNYCAVYHPRSYVRQELASDKFEIVDFIPGSKDKSYCLQDTYLLRRQQVA